MHCLTFSADSPGFVECKVWSSDITCTRHCVFDSSEVTTDLPEALTPTGLSTDRKKYLYEKIRDYCPDSSKDILCPLPVVEPAPTDHTETLQSTSAPIPSASGNPVETSEELLELPGAKRKTPLCSYCHESGHRNQIRNGKKLCLRREKDESRK